MEPLMVDGTTKSRWDPVVYLGWGGGGRACPRQKIRTKKWLEKCVKDGQNQTFFAYQHRRPSISINYKKHTNNAIFSRKVVENCQKTIKSKKLMSLFSV